MRGKHRLLLLQLQLQHLDVVLSLQQSQVSLPLVTGVLHYLTRALEEAPKRGRVRFKAGEVARGPGGRSSHAACDTAEGKET